MLQDTQERKELSVKDPMSLATTASGISCVKNGVSSTQQDCRISRNYNKKYIQSIEIKPTNESYNIII